MDSRALAALLCPLVSQLILLLSPLLPFSPFSPLSHHLPLLPLLHLFLSSDIVAATTVLLDPRKRRRLETEDESNPDNNNPVKYRVLEKSETLDIDKEQDNLDENNSPHNPENRGREHSGELPFIPRNPDSFPLHFRMSSSTFHYLVGLLEPLLDCRDPVHSPLNLSPELRLAIGLFRLGTGLDYSEAAAFFKVSVPVARFCTKQLCRVLCTNFRFWVGFPDQDELVKVSKGFEERTGLPNGCGVIGCTRFRVGGNDSSRSVAVQMVVDSECRILSIVAGFDGKKNDWSILKSSSLYKDINDGKLLNNSNRRVDVDGVEIIIPQYLVGVGPDYPLLPWLQVMFPDPTSPGSHGEDFNAGYDVMRGLMRRTVASLRNWGVLNKAIEGECRNAVAYIGACAILHNGLLLREDFSALSNDLGVEDDDDGRGVHDHHGSRPKREGEGSEQGRQGLQIRNALAVQAKHFRMLRESES